MMFINFMRNFSFIILNFNYFYLKITIIFARTLLSLILIIQFLDLSASSNGQIRGISSHHFDIEEIIDEDDSHCELSGDDEDLDENFIMDTYPKHKALIPTTCPVGDEVTGTTMFIEEFLKRYHPLIPVFLNGNNY